MAQIKVQEDTELLDYLFRKLHPQSRTSIRNLLSKAMVQVNGKTVTAYNFKIHPGDTISISGKSCLIRTRQDKRVRIVYEDNWIIVACKEAGLPTISTGKGNGEATAYSIITGYVAGGNTGNRIYIVHRLDRDTSGLLLFAKDEKTKRILQDNWNDIVSQRKYVAVAEGLIQEEYISVTSWLKENPKSLKVHSCPYDNGGKKAITHFHILGHSAGHTIVEAELETGRKNQIRVHLSSIGHPISGDYKYGASSCIIKRLALHAKSICFTHPITGKSLAFDTGIPSAFNI